MAHRPTVVTRARREVLAYIRSNELDPGDRLPPVSVLAEQSEISVSAMREALQGLHANGIVEFRHGTGVFVRRSSDQLILPNLPDTQLDGPTISGVLEARLLIEPRLAYLAATRVIDDDIDHLARILAECTHEAQSDDTLCEVTIDFHRAISRRSGHPVLAQIVDSLLEIYSNEQHLITYLHGNRQRDYEGHAQILEALRLREPDHAYQAMSLHLEDVSDIVHQKLDKVLRSEPY